MDEDIRRIFDLLEHAVYMHILAVKSGAVPEKTDTFSRVPEKRAAQARKRWSLASLHLTDRGLTVEPHELPAALAVPYRRRYRADQHDQLQRLVSLVDRLRTPLMEVLISCRIGATCKTEEGADLGELLFYSLAHYDFAHVAELADEFPEVRAELVDILRVTRREFLAMHQLREDEPSSVSLKPEKTGRFDPTLARR